MAGNTGDTGNTGNTGDTGNTGNSGSAGIAGEFGGGWFIEDRVDLPFVMELDSANAPLRFKRLSRSSYRAFHQLLRTIGGDARWRGAWAGSRADPRWCQAHQDVQE